MHADAQRPGGVIRRRHPAPVAAPTGSAGGFTRGRRSFSSVGCHSDVAPSRARKAGRFACFLVEGLAPGGHISTTCLEGMTPMEFILRFTGPLPAVGPVKL